MSYLSGVIATLFAVTECVTATFYRGAPMFVAAGQFLTPVLESKGKRKLVKVAQIPSVLRSAARVG